MADPGVDLEALKQVADHQYLDDRPGTDVCSWLISQLPAVIAALERAERVEKALVTGLGETERLACAFTPDCATKPPPKGLCWGCRVRAALAPVTAEEKSGG